MLHGVTTIVGIGLIFWAWRGAVLGVFSWRSATGSRPPVRAGVRLGLHLSRRLPAAASSRLLNLLGPLGLLAATVARLLTLDAGFALATWGVDGAPPVPTGLRELEFWRTGPGVLEHLSGWSMGLLLAVLTARLVLMSEALRRQEQPIDALTGDRSEAIFAETLLVDRLDARRREELDRRLRALAAWLTTTGCGHLRYPTLALVRPPGQRSWLQTSVLVLDAAALTRAIAPSWAEAGTGDLLTAGIRTLRSLAEQYEVTVRPTALSLQGLEERGFGQTYRYAVRGGLPAERSEAEAWAAFQQLRTQYAPVAAMIGQALGYELGRNRPWRRAPEAGAGLR